MSYLWFVLILPLMVIGTVAMIIYRLIGGETRIVRSRAEVAEILDDVISGTGQSAFGAYLHIAIEDLQLDSVRLRCLEVPTEYPADEKGCWCSPAGMDELRRFFDELRRHDS